MPAPLVSPYGELASLGVSKETIFGTFVAPTIFHAIEDFTPSPSNQLIQRQGARKRRGRSLPIVDGYVGKASFTPECDPDVVGQLIAYAMGAQTTPAHTVKGSSTSSTAYSSTLTLGALPSFSTEINRVTDAVDLLGCKVNGMSLSFDPGKGLTPKFDLSYATEAVQASPTTPTFSTKLPFSFTNPANVVQVFGAVAGQAGQVTVHQFSVDLKNNLVTNYYSAGSGSRAVVDLPQQGAMVSGKARLGFETDLAYQKFLGGATAPGNTVAGVAFDLALFTSDQIDGTLSINYGIEIIVPNCVISTHSAKITSGGIIYQDISFEAGESANGANDDLKIVLTNIATTVY